MTIVEWRSVRERVKSARKILDDEAFIQMRTVIAQASPLAAQTIAYGANVTDGDRSRFLGKIEGYQECLANLDKLGVYAPVPKEVKISYEPPEQ
jgi:hypothetical protein